MGDKVIVGLSGGVDSAVAAALLQQEGYDVVGVTISPFNLGEYYPKYEKDSGCTIKANVQDAQNICKVLGIPHYTVDFSDTFKENVVDYFIQEYLDGRTPNPCVKCNPIIKWGELLKFADKLGAKHLATGHYARVRFEEELKRYVLMRGTDRTKDQSYFLWKLSQEQLSRTIFPLGYMKKENTRAIAKELGLPVYNKPESQEVCFIADDDYHNFLSRTVDDIDSKVGEGDIVFEGKVIGRHKGYPFYTIGQRKGLGISYKESLYVLRIDAEKNIIEVGRNDELLNSGIVADAVNLIKYDKLTGCSQFLVKLRYKDQGAEAYCEATDDNELRIGFLEPRRAITPGQSVVMYEGEDIIGGGIIREWF